VILFLAEKAAISISSHLPQIIAVPTHKPVTRAEYGFTNRSQIYLRWHMGNRILLFSKRD